MRLAARLLLGGACLLAMAAPASAATGSLTWLEQRTDPGLSGARGVAVSADGKSVYVAGQDSDALRAYSRNPSTGALTPNGCAEDSDNGSGGAPVNLGCAVDVNGLNSPRFIAISPNGDFVYVTGGDDNAVVALTRNTTTGALTAGQCFTDSAGPASGCTSIATSAVLDGAEGIGIGPGGGQVYVAAQDAGTLVTLTRNSGTGALALAGTNPCFSNGVVTGCTDLTGTPMANPRELAVAPDGKSVYVAAASSNGITKFPRNTGDGSLSALADPFEPGPNLPVGIRVAPNSANVYVAAVNDKAVRIFSRNATTSDLTAAGCVKDVGAPLAGCTTAEGLNGAEGVAVSPDGASVYASGASDNAVVAFARGGGGGLTGLGCLRSPAGGGCGSAFGTARPLGLAVSPDGKNVYVAGSTSAAVSVFKRDTTSGSGGGGGGGGNPTPPPQFPLPPQCVNPSTLLVTCANPGGPPGICSVNGPVYPQCQEPVVLPTVCGGSGTPLPVCQPPGNSVVACGGFGTVLPECHLPPPSVPQVCGPSGTLLPPCTGGNNPVTVCGGHSALPQCNLGGPIDATPLSDPAGNGSVDVNVNCNGANASAASARAHAAQRGPRTCPVNITLANWILATRDSLRSTAFGVSRDYLNPTRIVNESARSGTSVHTLQNYAGVNQNTFNRRAYQLIDQFPGINLRANSVERNLAAQPYVGPGAIWTNSNAPELFGVYWGSADTEYAFRKRSGSSALSFAAAKKGKVVLARKRVKLRRGKHRRIRLRLRKSVVRQLLRTLPKKKKAKARFAIVRVIVSTKGKGRPVVRVKDIRLKIRHRKPRQRRRR